MRTTLDIDDDLLSEARRRAKDEGTTLTALVERALANLLTQERVPESFALNLETEEGSYIGGVDVSDRDALYDVMEGRE